MTHKQNLKKKINKKTTHTHENKGELDFETT